MGFSILSEIKLKKSERMKTKAITAIMMMLFLASTVMALFPLSVKAKATKTYFTGTETPVQTIDSGTEWMSGKIYHLRGDVSVYRDECTDPRFTGNVTAVANLNLDVTKGRGSIWGTSITVSDVEGGFWEGTFAGKMYADGSMSIRGVCHGIGLFEGLKAKFTMEGIDTYAISGYILEK
jgi:hypothetical protein